MDKVEIKDIIERKILKVIFADGKTNPKITDINLDEIASSITALIIKWLEEKITTINKDDLDFEDYPRQSGSEKIGRNQLITELIGELR